MLDKLPLHPSDFIPEYEDGWNTLLTDMSRKCRGRNVYQSILIIMVRSGEMLTAAAEFLIWIQKWPKNGGRGNSGNSFRKKYAQKV